MLIFYLQKPKWLDFRIILCFKYTNCALLYFPDYSDFKIVLRRRCYERLMYVAGDVAAVATRSSYWHLSHQ